MDANVTRRIRALEARLRTMTPLVTYGTSKLYQGIDGLFVVSYRAAADQETMYLGVNQDGQIADLRGYRVDRADIQITINCFQAARLHQMVDKVTAWSNRRQG